ncbi:CTTNBP2 N-terminal like b isoform X1 [Tachysurus ichikawai]
MDIMRKAILLSHLTASQHVSRSFFCFIFFIMFFTPSFSLPAEILCEEVERYHIHIRVRPYLHSLHETVQKLWHTFPRGLPGSHEESAQQRDAFVQERYGRYDLSDPFMALQRDSEAMEGHEQGQTQTRGLGGRSQVTPNPLAVLKLVMSHCKRMQEKMMAQLAAAESRHKRASPHLTSQTSSGPFTSVSAGGRLDSAEFWEAGLVWRLSAALHSLLEELHKRTHAAQIFLRQTIYENMSC